MYQMVPNNLCSKILGVHITYPEFQNFNNLNLAHRHFVPFSTCFLVPVSLPLFFISEEIDID